MAGFAGEGMKRFRRWTQRVAAALWAPLLLLSARAFAEEPYDWQLGWQPAASPVREHIDALHNVLLVVITLITLFVLGLLLYVMFRFSAKRHPVPSKITHNTVIEIIWTLVPVLILVAIAVPSFKLLYYMDKNPHATMTIKITGHQWYWSYEYPDQGDLSFNSNMLDDDTTKKEGKPRLLAVDNPVVVPVGTVVRVLVAGTDVIHSWFVPAVGVQEYAMPGRTNEAWLQIDRPGVYYGQCNQICGINHPFMPIEIHAVSQDDFAKWVDGAKKQFGRNDQGGGALQFAADAAQ
ncbi:MAG TPA: cytochrome c oxidase subunit II [Stellaceae bacterium]|nr:cytochrome c oxidase subunit II [Stellaceae bacterium]